MRECEEIEAEAPTRQWYRAEVRNEILYFTIILVWRTLTSSMRGRDARWSVDFLEEFAASMDEYCQLDHHQRQDEARRFAGARSH